MIKSEKSLIKEKVDLNNINIRAGFNSHYYVFSRNYDLVEQIAKVLNRKTGIYYNEKYRVWVLKIKNKNQKRKLKQFKKIMKEIKRLFLKNNLIFDIYGECDICGIVTYTAPVQDENSGEKLTICKECFDTVSDIIYFEKYWEK